jgi:prevent-host-death family protein
MPSRLAAGEFKAKCLKLLDEVSQRRTSIVITKRGKPVAQLVPIEPPEGGIFSEIIPTFEIVGDIICPTGEIWDAER